MSKNERIYGAQLKNWLEGKCTDLNAYVRKKFQINNLHFYHKKLKKEQIKSNASKRKGKIKIRAEVNEI